MKILQNVANVAIKKVMINASSFIQLHLYPQRVHVCAVKENINFFGIKASEIYLTYDLAAPYKFYFRSV